MKKLLIGLVACLSVLAVAFATDVQTAFTQREIRDPRLLETILETNFGELDLAIKDADGSAYIVQTTNVTMHAGTVWTQTRATVFGAAPTTVIVTPTELHAAIPFVSSVTASNLLVTVEASKNFLLTCIGKRP